MYVTARLLKVKVPIMQCMLIIRLFEKMAQTSYARS